LVAVWRLVGRTAVACSYRRRRCSNATGPPCPAGRLGDERTNETYAARGAPWTEAQIAYAVQLWVSGMTHAEIAVNYGYAIRSKIRIFSLRYAPAREDLDAKAKAA